MLTDEGEPLTFKEAISCEQKNMWELEIQEEINDTWDLVELPKVGNLFLRSGYTK